MTCQAVQNTILALPDPRRVPDALRVHLDGCPACLGWWRQAARLEALLEHLPVPHPPAGKKAALVDDLTAAGPVIKSVPSVRRAPGQRWVTGRAALYAGGLAAAVLVVVGLVRLFPGPAPQPAPRPEARAPRHPFLERLVQRDVALAREATPEKRLALLGDLADDVAAETRTLARVGNPDELDELAGLFGEVVLGDPAARTGIVPRAEALRGAAGLTADEKRALFDRVARKLSDVGAEADRAARESPPGAQVPLFRIRDAAAAGERRLREFAGKQGA